MENKSQQKGKKLIAFLKRNAYYVIIIVCIAAIATILGVTLSKDRNATPPGMDQEIPSDVKPDPNNPDGGGETPVDGKPTPVIFCMPVENATVLKDFVMDSVVWNGTLRQYEAHNGIDFKAAEGASVKVVYGGKVVKISYDILLGNVVTVKHSDSLTTTYGSLGEVKVAVGDTLKMGDIIGTVGVTMGRESADGAHLHFQTLLSGISVNGNTYFSQGDK